MTQLSSLIGGGQGTQGIQGIQGRQGIQGITGAASINNNVNDRVLTATGGTSIEAESNLTFNGTSLITTGDMRASIFYDQDNTAYYVNPASTSLLLNLETRNFITIGQEGGYEFGNPNQEYVLIDSGFNSGLPGIKSPIYYSLSTTSYYVNPASTSRLKDLVVQDRVDAPIYYDSDNTAYYVDPASTSRLSTLEVNERVDSAIYYSLSTTTYYMNPASTSRLATLEVNERVDAPIYYDLDNTAYYVNPGDTSRLASLLVAFDTGMGTTSPAYKLDVTVTIRATGDVIAFSDIRVKENIKTIENALDKVMKIRGVEYNKIGESRTSLGVIAQEIEEVLPQVVHIDNDGMKSVSYNSIIGVLIEAIKEQQQQIDDLKNKNN